MPRFPWAPIIFILLAAMSATVIPLLMYDKLYPLGDLPEGRERGYWSRTPPLYSLSCVNRRPSVHTGRSPPEEEQSCHSVRVQATCGGTNHPSSPQPRPPPPPHVPPPPPPPPPRARLSPTTTARGASIGALLMCVHTTIKDCLLLLLLLLV